MADESVNSKAGDGVETVKPPADAFTEIGNKGLFKYTGFTYEEFLPELQGRKAARVYREMMDNDAIVGAVLFAIEMVIRRVEWAVKPGGETPEDIEASEFVASCMTDMSHSWEDFISDVLTMLPFGYAYIETVYKYREGPTPVGDSKKKSQFSDGRMGWRKMVLIPQETVQEFEFDDYGGVRCALQMAPMSGMVKIPIEKSLLFQTTRRLPYGRSVLRPGYRSYYFKKRIEEIEAIGIERDLAGYPVMYIDPMAMQDDRKRRVYQEIVQNIRRDQQEGVLLPSLFDENGNRLISLELLNSGGSRQFDINGVVNRYSRQIAMTVLQDVIMLGHERVGSQALAVEKRDMSDTALAAWLTAIAAVINDHAVPKLLLYNGMASETPPRIVPGDIKSTDILEFTQAVSNAALAGFSLAGDPDIEDYMRRKLGLPLLSQEDREILAVQQEMALADPMGLGEASADESATGEKDREAPRQARGLPKKDPGVAGARPTKVGPGGDRESGSRQAQANARNVARQKATGAGNGFGSQRRGAKKV